MVPAVLLYGMVCCLDEKYQVAADLFELATSSDPTNVIAWTMRGVLAYVIYYVVSVFLVVLS